MVAIVMFLPGLGAIASAVAPSLFDKFKGWVGGLFSGDDGNFDMGGLLGSLGKGILGGAGAYSAYKNHQQAAADQARSRELLDRGISEAETVAGEEVRRFNEQFAPVQQAYTNAVYGFSDPTNPFSRNPFAGMQAPLFQLGMGPQGPPAGQGGAGVNPDPSLRPVTEGGNQGTELATGDKNNYDLRNESGATEGEYSSYDEQMVDIERNAPTYLEPVEGTGGQQFDPTEDTGGSMYQGVYIPPGVDPTTYIQGMYGQPMAQAQAPNPDAAFNPFAATAPQPMLAPINPQPTTGGFAPAPQTAPTGPTPYPPPPQQPFGYTGDNPFVQ